MKDISLTGRIVDILYTCLWIFFILVHDVFRADLDRISFPETQVGALNLF